MINGSEAIKLHQLKSYYEGGVYSPQPAPGIYADTHSAELIPAFSQRSITNRCTKPEARTAHWSPLQQPVYSYPKSTAGFTIRFPIFLL